jgi:hypothetical protein
MAQQLDVEKSAWCVGCGAPLHPGEPRVLVDDYWWFCSQCAETEPEALEHSAWIPATPPGRS